MDITFDQINKVVLETLQPQVEKAEIFDVIGKWYYTFLRSNEKRIHLKLPYHNPRSINDIYQYLRLFLLTYKLINRSRLTIFKDTCIFNIFEYKRNYQKVTKESPFLPFVREKGNLLTWEKDILIRKDVFLPVFYQSQCEGSNWNNLSNTFELFKIIRKNGIILYPILIDLEKDLLLSLSSGKELIPKDLILFETIAYERNTNVENDIKLEEQLDTMKISDQISIKYPYSRNIRSWFLEIAQKRFELNINDRFCYSEISDDDLFLLPRETFLNKKVLDNFDSLVRVLNTSHNRSLYELVSDLKEKWQEYEFNKFTTPFPKYWLLFINKSLSSEEWLRQFKVNYPNVAEKPIIKDIEKIIIELIDLNWVELMLKGLKGPRFLVPNMKGAKGKRIEAAFSSFKHFLSTIDPTIGFVQVDDHYNYSNYTDLIILECFSVIDLVNIIQNNKPGNYKIIIPDFLYFNYQPWIKYHLANYQFEALLNHQRKMLDNDYEVHSNVWKDLKISITREIRSEIREYREKYDVATIESLPSDIITQSEDFELVNDEEIDLITLKRDKGESADLNIILVEGQEARLAPKSEVLIQRNTIVIGKACDLKQGDYFISIKELNSSIDYDKVIERLGDIPDTVQLFQVKLNEHKNVYQILGSRGLQYSSENYFNDHYLIALEDFNGSRFMIPRKRKHWELICEFLNIDTNDMAQTWIAHYGRKHLNEIKGIYRHILNLFLREGFLGQSDNPVLIEKVSQYVQSKEHAFDKEGEFDPHSIAHYMISSILSIIDFHEVKEIKTISK